jgi:hypothetical protein
VQAIRVVGSSRSEGARATKSAGAPGPVIAARFRHQYRLGQRAISTSFGSASNLNLARFKGVAPAVPVPTQPKPSTLNPKFSTLKPTPLRPRTPSHPHRHTCAHAHPHTSGAMEMLVSRLATMRCVTCWLNLWNSTDSVLTCTSGHDREPPVGEGGRGRAERERGREREGEGGSVRLMSPGTKCAIDQNSLLSGCSAYPR